MYTYVHNKFKVVALVSQLIGEKLFATVTHKVAMQQPVRLVFICTASAANFIVFLFLDIITTIV
jgi:hypothetical protein